jgi:purine-binding chemotaxis protein CheW
VTSGYVLFRLADQTFATPLDMVREIVRLTGIAPLPGTKPPMAGVIVLRGVPLPVLDVRCDAGDQPSGDCLVVELDGEVVGVAVDGVVGVLQPDELDAGDPPGGPLPSYVTGVGRRGSEAVLMVDLKALVAAA